MTAKFEHFTNELAFLCGQHKVTLIPTATCLVVIDEGAAPDPQYVCYDGTRGDDKQNH